MVPKSALWLYEPKVDLLGPERGVIATQSLEEPLDRGHSGTLLIWRNGRQCGCAVPCAFREKIDSEVVTRAVIVALSRPMSASED